MASGGSASGTTSKNDDSKWYFTAEQLANSPSRKCGMDADQELMYRQRAANLIQDMGQRLQVSQLCINTAIVYMHRFYAFHSFTQFHRNSIAAASLFLAAKVEEQPRKLEHIIKVVHICLGLDAPDPMRENYAEQAQDLVFNENVLLQTLGFDVAIDHPHTHVVKTCHLVKASKDLAQTSYFMASNSLHLTTMCLQYKPTVVACFCIHLACKWSRWEIPQSNEGRHWFQYVDKTVTLDLLKQLTDEFLHIFDRCPTRLKSKMKSIRADSGAEESGRRAGSSSSSSIMAAPSSSSAARGIDEGSSTSSSTSSHHRPKQSSEMMKQHGMSSSGSHQKNPSSSSSGSRSRSDRPSAGLSQSSSGSSAGQQQQPPQHYGGNSSSNAGKGPSSMSHRSSMQQPPAMSQSSTNSSSQRSNSGYQGHDGSKSRQPSSATGMMSSGGAPTGVGASSSSSGSSSSMHSGYNQMKADRHSGGGGQKMPSKPQSSSSASSGSVAPLYNAKHQQQQQHQQQPQQQQQQQQQQGSQQASSLFSHPPSYNQSISGRSSNLPLSDQQPPTGAAGAGSAQTKPESSSFRLLDESIGRLPDPMQICTPPKQSKPSSIFSPDWKDTQHESLQNVPSGKSGRSGGHYGNAAGAGSSDRLQKPPKGSPGGKKQQMQHHGSSATGGSRSDGQKKERRSEGSSGAAGQQQHPSGKHQSTGHEKKSMVPSGASGSLPTIGGSGGSNSGNSHTSHSVKRSADGSNIPPATSDAGLTGNGAAASASGASGSSASMQAKRPHPSNEQIRQDDGTDFREQKMRRMESSSSSFLSGSPTDHLFSSSFDLASTFDKMDDSSSLFNFNDPGSLLSQPLLNDSKPSTLAKSGGIFSNTINGIETNAALVSSLLKESLFNETPKFGSLYGGSGMDETPTSGTRTDSVDSKPTDVNATTSGAAADTKPQIPSIESLLGQPLSQSNQPQPGPSGSTGDPAQAGLAPPSYPWVAANATLPGDAPAISAAASMNTQQPLERTTTGTADPAPAATIATNASTASDPDTDQGNGGHRSKSEKKKKKEKHKHKEKDKTKDRDREEKKKHKKDKDKHRDKEHREKGDGNAGPGPAPDALASGMGAGGQQHSSQDHPPPPGPIKIKLNRAIIPPVMDATSHPSGGGTGGAGSVGGSANDGLKIKIPKDRLSGSSSLPGGPSVAGSVSTAGGSHGGSFHNTSGAGGASTGGGSASLKLKISKDKIEHYNISATSDPAGGGQHHGAMAGAAGPGNVGMGGNMNMPIAGSSTGGTTGGSNSKKKDKDRDKDREKSKSKSSSSSSEHGSRQNGSGATVSGNSSSKSSSKNLSNAQQSQLQPQQYGMFNANQAAAAASLSAASMVVGPAMHGFHHQQPGFDYLQQQQSVAALQQQQYYSQYSQYGQQQQQQQQQQFQQQMAASGAGSMMMNAPGGGGVGAGMIGKLPGQQGTGMQPSALPPFYYGGGPGAGTASNQGGGGTGKK